jgi:uncharacterized protein YdaU (DUF1376 family)
MADYPAMQLWTDAYLADTTDLSAEEHGAYLLLLMAAWRTPDCALPDDDQRLARMARVGTKKWHKLRPVMERFFTVDARGWTQKRLLKERERSDMYRSQKSQAGKASARKRNETASTDVATEGATGKQPPLTTPKPIRESAPNGAGRATRLPDDWTLPEEWQAWALEEGWPAERVVFEAERFRDYWHAAGGQNARKRDWFATWRNWMRREPKNNDRTDRKTERNSPHDKLLAGFAAAARDP